LFSRSESVVGIFGRGRSRLMDITTSRSDAYTIKEMIKGRVKFQFFRDNTLYYQTENGITFPVPINDTGTATFLAEDKGILFMRYIRKFLASLNEEGKNE
jgi:hypothetical protein